MSAIILQPIPTPVQSLSSPIPSMTGLTGRGSDRTAQAYNINTAAARPSHPLHIYLPVSDRLIRVTTSSQSRSSLAG